MIQISEQRYEQLLNAEKVFRWQSFQRRTSAWMLETFGPEIPSNVIERGDRLLEEVFELLQSKGYDASRASVLLDYVFNRPVGDPFQETGGVMVTLAAFCGAANIDMHIAGENELARVWTMVDVIRAKRAAKLERSPLPTSTPAPAPAQKCPQCAKAWEQAKTEYDAGGSPSSPPAICHHGAGTSLNNSP